MSVEGSEKSRVDLSVVTDRSAVAASTRLGLLFRFVLPATFGRVRLRRVCRSSWLVEVNAPCRVTLLCPARGRAGPLPAADYILPRDAPRRGGVRTLV